MPEDGKIGCVKLRLQRMCVRSSISNIFSIDGLENGHDYYVLKLVGDIGVYIAHSNIVNLLKGVMVGCAWRLVATVHGKICEVSYLSLSNTIIFAETEGLTR